MLDKPKPRGRKPGAVVSFWTPDETDTLIQYLNQGLGASRIARLMNRSVNAIHERRRRLNMPVQFPQRVNGYITDRVSMHIGVEQHLADRFAAFCHDRGASKSVTIETLLEAFMNQVEEAEANAENT